jgi:hypothetical protein
MALLSVALLSMALLLVALVILVVFRDMLIDFGRCRLRSGEDDSDVAEAASAV